MALMLCGAKWCSAVQVVQGGMVHGIYLVL